MNASDSQKHLFECRVLANKNRKTYGTLKPKVGPVFYAEIETPIKSSLTFADSIKFPGCVLIAYGFPVISGKGKINPIEWKRQQNMGFQDPRGYTYHV